MIYNLIRTRWPLAAELQWWCRFAHNAECRRVVSDFVFEWSVCYAYVRKYYIFWWCVCVCVRAHGIRELSAWAHAVMYGRCSLSV